MTKLYRPANGTEGEMFTAHFCDRCQHEAAWRADPERAAACLINVRAFAYDVGDPEYPSEWISGPEGPTCTAFELERPPEGAVQEPWPRCPATIDLFESTRP